MEFLKLTKDSNGQFLLVNVSYILLAENRGGKAYVKLKTGGKGILVSEPIEDWTDFLSGDDTLLPLLIKGPSGETNTQAKTSVSSIALVTDYGTYLEVMGNEGTLISPITLDQFQALIQTSPKQVVLKIIDDTGEELEYEILGNNYNSDISAALTEVPGVINISSLDEFTEGRTIPGGIVVAYDPLGNKFEALWESSDLVTIKAYASGGEAPEAGVFNNTIVQITTYPGLPIIEEGG